MLFNSFAFLVFFPLVTIIYFLLPFKFRWMWLLLASCVFYMFFIPQYIIILFVTITIDYWAGIKIASSTGKARKRYLLISIISTILVLVIFKYANFFNSNVAALAHFIDWNYPLSSLNIILPIGLSFHTFQSLSYVVEVYRGNHKPEKHFGIYSLYVMFYPQLVAGPIERPQNILYQFYIKHKPDYKQITSGLKLMAWGFFKKLVIADRLSAIINPVYNHPGQYSGGTLIFVTLLFAQQIYCDFSGYSDIAIGIARVMGFKLMKNFDRPYSSKSVSEFWTRWHISLSTWFRDYVYIPMGGSRVGKWRWYYNLMITFLLSGFWHGANWTYVIWGGLNGLYLIIEVHTKDWRKKAAHTIKLTSFPRLETAVQVFLTVMFISLAWVFFRANTSADAFQIVAKIFTSNPFNINFKSFIDPYSLSLCIIFILILEFVQGYHKKIDLIKFIEKKPAYFRFALYTVFLLILLNFGIYSSKGFIYFQF
jgi:alginate O-acetyltransferase complex protein AlgI